jgi:hypothetical protein
MSVAPVPGLVATTAAGLARRLSDAQWAAVERFGLVGPRPTELRGASVLAR